MPDFGSSTFSQTDGSNNTGTQPSWSGSAAPSTIDDAGRALQGAITREWNWRNYTLTAAGTADAKTLTYSVAPAAYYNGQRFAFIANTTNTGSCTLNVNSVGAKTIKSMLTGTLANLAASDMVAGMFVEVAYNTSNDCFVWVNENDTVLPQGLDTTDSPEFAAVNIGAATDTTVTRASAGRLAVEGVNVALETDVEGQQTIWVPAAAMTSRTTNGAASGSEELATNDVMVKYLAFDATTSEAAQFMIQMPKSWNEGTIIAQFLWKHPATTTNFGVKWGIRALAFANDDAMDAAFGTEQEVADTGGTTADLYISDETSAMTVGGSPGAEELVVFEVYRDPADGSDTMAVDAHLIGVKLHYTTDAAKDD